MVRPKKFLGQHFLTDQSIAKKIVDSLTVETGNLIEIGPGKGILSQYLLQNKKRNTWYIETDEESVNYLKSTYPKIKQTLIKADFLRHNLKEIFGEEKFTIIGNFPYNISSQIFFKTLEHKNQVDEVIGMIQKEVAERLASPPGSKKYGILSVLLQAYYKIEYLFTVNEGVFFPPPKVKSAVIRLSRNNVTSIGCNDNDFKAVVKTGFNQRRKTLRNALKSFTFKQSEEITHLLTKRAEQLSVADFVFLTKNVIE
ncbi:MAG: 16S rRNA (adenine(1518)-N(6)/adenine(1519)-N(6))-dimethyltransferase RsmA [Bacteroidetes bacterium]|nr:16S rRNA (adenine(1518)-N(6)/adenine(1519)-N(6))-dimethyltransferase RsmA [Bacteroidota bacterium]